MQKAIETMTDREILEELLQERRRDRTKEYIRWGLYAAALLAVAILCAVYLPPVIDYFRKLHDAVEQIRQGMDQVRAAADTVRDAVTRVGQGGSEALESALARLNELLEKLPAVFR